jgi:hypothetical protein
MFTVMKFHGQFSPSERDFDAISRTNFKTLNGYEISCLTLNANAGAIVLANP